VPRLALIVNRFATGVTPERIHRVEQELRRTADVETLPTSGPGDAGVLANQAAASADAVVVFAGDGTANEAINGAAGRVPFGFLPGGGASIFARTLGLPRDPVEAAAIVAAALAGERSRPVDLGRVNGRLFTFSAGIGLDAEVVRRVDSRGRRADGRRPRDLAFVGATVGAIASRRGRFEPQLEIVGRGRCAFVLVGCGRPYTYLGPLAIRLAPGATGLEFAAPGRAGPASLPALVLRLLRGRIAGSSRVLAAGGIERLEVRCDQPLPLQVDGEDLGDVTEAVFEAEPAAIAVLV
jgi:diacylglycerol kinase family enzyme